MISTDFQRTNVLDDRNFSQALIQPVKDEIIEAIQDIFERDASWILKWTADNFAPEQVFDHDALEDWALNNGFVAE